MGYTGRILVARTVSRPTVEGVEVLDARELGDGWWSIQLDGDAPGMLTDLVSRTARPAVSAFVLDSDCADVEGATPAGAHWHAYLNRDIAQNYGAPALDRSDDEIIEQALAWSADAGLTAGRTALRDVLEATNVFAEEAFDELLQALGIPGA